jgi:hypothetical protein
VADLRIRIGNHGGQTAFGEVVAHRQTGLAGADYEDGNLIGGGGSCQSSPRQSSHDDHAFP